MSKIIPYGHQSIDESDIQVVIKVLKADRITQGPEIDKFENALAKFVGAKYAVATSSGTAALHAACIACGITQGDEVIVPTLSFIASANCVLYCGGKPVLVDIYPDTLTINVEEVERKITKKTKALIAVDFAGHPAHWDKLKKLAQDHKLILIDDASHALGSKYRRKPIGSIANLTVFSFHPVKIITTGEGGAVTTNNRKLYEKILSLRHHGIIKNRGSSKKRGGWFYQINELGYNYRMTDIQGALGISQLKKIDEFIEKRREIWQKYNKSFDDIRGLTLPIEKKGSFCAWHLYPVRFNQEVLGIDRKVIFEKLQTEGLGVQVHYIPIHMHDLYRKRFGYKAGDFPVAEQYYKEVLSLPLFPKMANAEINFVVKTLKDADQKS